MKLEPKALHTCEYRYYTVMLGCVCIAAILLMTRVPGFVDGYIHVGYKYAKNLIILTAVFAILSYITARLGYMFKQPLSPIAPLAWDKAYFRTFPWREILVSVSGYTLTMTCFTVHKSLFIGRDGYRHDAWLAQLDQTILGDNGWVLTHTWFPSSSATHVFDILYHPAFYPMLVGYLVCATTRSKPALRYTYMASFVAGFVFIGMIMPAALNSAGPIYDGDLFGDGSTFGPLKVAIDAHQDTIGKMSAALFQEYLLNTKLNDVANFGSGISAMPSMHVVMAFLWAFAAWHINRILGVVVTAYAILIWLISVHLGWHYFVDGLVGLFAIGAVWAILGRIFGLYSTQNPPISDN
jgi:hypothetical protein